MGLGSAGDSQFKKGMNKARARAAAYSDDEYDDLSQFQRRKRRGAKKKEKETSADDFSMGSDKSQDKDFWDEAEDRGSGEGGRSRKQRTYYNESKEQFEKKVFDEFDDFFNFSDQQGYDASRDDTKGTDYKADLTVGFLEAINGCDKEITLNKRIPCKACKGRRADSAIKPRICFECGGRGSIIGNYGIRKKCPKCEGAGCKTKTPCGVCEGLGVQRLDINEWIYLPQGIKDAQKIRIHNLGHSSDCYSSAPGDLLLTIKVEEHESFKRDDQHIVTELPITISQAILGAKVTIETVDGKLNIEIPAGT